MRSLKKRVIQADQSLLLDKAKKHPSQSLVAHVASSVGWMKIWDMTLDHGPGGTTALLSILKLICKPVFALCMVECNYVIPADCALCEHFLTHHTDLNFVVLRTCSFTASIEVN